ncbi:hypothetical protein vBSenI1_116 [Salmonella phage vB_Sen_I1]|uniref:Uncharacterized protein n=1 Tax=Salmonella phage vB_Sen_I1 TaxID=2723910 RepID=A0A7L5CHS1_9CAUD|nr:hypothetical protein vBSenI1_116 [Salmonella phage vB_Sen_I1]
MVNNFINFRRPGLNCSGLLCFQGTSNASICPY